MKWTQSKPFRLTGIIQLIYRQYTTETTNQTGTLKSESNEWEQLYKLRAEGYIWKPKFAVFKAEVSYLGRDSEYDYASADYKEKTKSISYYASLQFFPRRPISLSLFAMQIDTTRENGYSFDTPSKGYGGSLVIARRKWPVNIMLSYNHWDYTAERFVTLREEPGGEDNWDDWGDWNDGGGYDDWGDWDDNAFPQYKTVLIKDKRERDSYKLKLTGHIKKYRTRFNASYELIRQKAFALDNTIQIISLNTWTLIKKNWPLSTQFLYQGMDFYDLWSFRAFTTLPRIKNLSHSYSVEFMEAKYKASEWSSNEIKNSSYGVRALYTYTITHRFRIRGDLFYRHAKRNEEKVDYYSIGLDYSRPIKGLQLSASYDFFYRNSSVKDTYYQNSLYVDISTTKLKWGRIFSKYNFILRNYSQGETYETYLILGTEIRGPGKAHTTFEGEYYYAQSEGNNLLSNTYYEPISKNSRTYMHYALSGTIFYSPWKKLQCSSSVRYYNTIEPGDYTRFAYEFRVNYSILRNLYLSSFWKEEYTSSNSTDMQSRYYGININYRYRQVFLNLEYNIYESEDDWTDTNVHTLFVRLSRPITF